VRLSEAATQVIKDTAASQFGPGVEVWLFGSRVRDSARGGDIDLLVVRKLPLESRARAAAEFAAVLQWRLGDQRIDAVIDDGPRALPVALRARATRPGLVQLLRIGRSGGARADLARREKQVN
jgi:predicted nucleotidyltransferase